MLAYVLVYVHVITGTSGQTSYAATIVPDPVGTPVSGPGIAANTFDYPILSNVTLTCMVDPSPPASATYQWNTACYTNDNSRGETCFPHGQTNRIVTGYHLVAKDAGSSVCTVRIGGVDYSSALFWLRVSGIYL